VSNNASATALIANIQMNVRLDKLLQEKYVLLEQLSLNPEDELAIASMADLNAEIQIERKITGEDYSSALNQIRQLLDTQSALGVFYLAGAPLIANDIKEFIKSDISVFGFSILAIYVYRTVFVFQKTFVGVIVTKLCIFKRITRRRFNWFFRTSINAYFSQLRSLVNYIFDHSVYTCNHSISGSLLFKS
jgi:hypothetical protein